MSAQILDGRFSAEKIREGIKKARLNFLRKLIKDLFYRLFL